MHQVIIYGAPCASCLGTEFFAKLLSGSTHFYGNLKSYLDDNHGLRRDMDDTLREKES